VHLGSRLEEGVIRWADDTQEKALQLITAQVRDTVQAFCSEEYLTEWVASLEEKAGVAVANPEKAIKVIAKRAGFSETEAQGILSHFISGGQPTAGGFMQATTSFAQTIASPARAVEVEDKGEQVLAIAASL
jgi:beta-phosphoglucomutase-like phosphatase (HAD superfamily)